MPTVPVSGRADLTDAQWAVLEPLLPVGKKPGRPRTWPRRRLIDGIRWRTRAGCAVAGCARAVRAVGVGVWVVPVLAARWHLGGDLDRLQARADAAGLITWDVSVDSTVVRAHQHAAGARKKGICSRAARRGAHRAGRPWPGPLPRRPVHQDPPGV